MIQMTVIDPFNNRIYFGEPAEKPFDLSSPSASDAGTS